MLLTGVPLSGEHCNRTQDLGFDTRRTGGTQGNSHFELEHVDVIFRHNVEYRRSMLETPILMLQLSERDQMAGAGNFAFSGGKR